MSYHHCARSVDGVGVVLQSAVDVGTCLVISLLQEQNPGVGVEIGGVGGLCLHRLEAHLLGTLQVASQFGEVVGIVVEHNDVVLLPF